MYIRLAIEHMRKIEAFFSTINRQDSGSLDYIGENIDNSVIVTAKMENNDITMLLITSVIKNDYYLSDIVFTEKNEISFRELVKFTIDELRKDNRGLHIIYDNYPYNMEMSELLLECGFKCTFLNYIYKFENKIFPVKNNILINERTDEVRTYLYEAYKRVTKSNDVYLGTKSYLCSEEEINLDKTNIAIAKKSERIIGVAKFALVGDAIFINSLYADNIEGYIDLINYIRNLTNRNLEIGILPVRRDLMEVLSELKFVKVHSDYMYKLN